MSKKLEDFIRNNKEAFDEHDPSAALWKRIEKDLQTPGATAKVVKINWWKWAAAAMVIITAGVLSKPYWKPEQPADGKSFVSAPTDSSKKPFDSLNGETSLHDSPFLADDERPKTRDADRNDFRDNPGINDQKAPADGSAKEELYHYARLIELKQKEIADIKTNHPHLFEKFSEDLTALDNSYNNLKQKYDEGLNSEQLLSAMIENLKMQTALLNKQLEVTKRIKKEKKNKEDVKSI